MLVLLVAAGCCAVVAGALVAISVSESVQRLVANELYRYYHDAKFLYALRDYRTKTEGDLITAPRR